MSVVRGVVVTCMLAGSVRAERVAWVDVSASRGMMLLTEDTRVRAPWLGNLELGGFVNNRLGLGGRAYVAWQQHESSSSPSTFALGAQAVAQYWLDDDWMASSGVGIAYWWFCCDSRTEDPDRRGASITIPVEASIRYMPGLLGVGLTAMTSTVPLESAGSSATYHWAALLLSVHVRGIDHR